MVFMFPHAFDRHGGIYHNLPGNIRPAPVPAQGLTDGGGPGQAMGCRPTPKWRDPSIPPAAVLSILGWWERLGCETSKKGDTMNRNRRTSRSTGSGARAAASRKAIFVPDRIELELVGIIGASDGLADAEAGESVFIDGDECLLALVESLRGGSYAVPSFAAQYAAGAVSPRDRPLH